MEPHIAVIVTAVALAVALLAVARPMSTLAGRRVAAQPLDVDVDAEEHLLDMLAADVGAWLVCGSVLDGDSFTGSRSARYTRIDRGWRDREFEPLPEGADDKTAEAAVAAARTSTGSPDNPMADIMTVGGVVLAMAEGRALTTERAPVVETGDDTRPLERRIADTPARRPHKTAALCVTGLGIGAVGVAATFATVAGAILAVIAVGLLVGGGAVLSLVDWDSYMLDFATFFPWLAATWTVGVVAVVAEGEPRRLYGAFGAVGVIALFEGVSAVFKKLRGISQGFGDTLLAFVTAGVPAVLVGRWETGLISAVVAGITFAAWFAYWAARGKVTRQTPIAFGPFLVVGGVAALTLAAAGV